MPTQTLKKYKIYYLNLNFKFQKLKDYKIELSKAKDETMNSCDCDMFRPFRLRNIFPRCSDCVTNSLFLTYADADKDQITLIDVYPHQTSDWDHVKPSI